MCVCVCVCEEAFVAVQSRFGSIPFPCVRGVVARPACLSLSVAPCRLLSGHSLSLRCPAYWRQSIATSPYLKGSEAFQG